MSPSSLHTGWEREPHEKKIRLQFALLDSLLFPTKWRKPRDTIKLRASVAEVSAVTHMGPFVIMSTTGVVRASNDSATTLYAKSFAYPTEEKEKTIIRLFCSWREKKINYNLL